MNGESSRILVTGATGAIGPSVVSKLIDAGYRVRSMSMGFPPAEICRKGGETIMGDVTDKSDVQRAMKNVDCVIHMAALLHVVNPSSTLRMQYDRINVTGTSTVVEAALQVGVRRIVFFSTIAVYGDSNGEILNELSVAMPDTYYGETKFAAEQVVLNARSGENGQAIGTVLRLGAVYGSRVKGNYERLAKALGRNRFIPIGEGGNRRSLIYDKDVASAALLATEHPSAAGRIFNVTDGRFHTLKEVICAICGALGREPPSFSVPEGLARAIAGGVDKTAQFIGLKSLALERMIDKYTEDIAVDGTLFQRELGFAPHYDLATGWQETISQMRSIGRL